jgi:hypothetical protein
LLLLRAWLSASAFCPWLTMASRSSRSPAVALVDGEQVLVVEDLRGGPGTGSHL